MRPPQAARKPLPVLECVRSCGASDFVSLRYCSLILKPLNTVRPESGGGPPHSTTLSRSTELRMQSVPHQPIRVWSALAAAALSICLK